MDWRALTDRERRLGVLYGLGVVVAVALRPLWLVLAPFLPDCRFRELTGLPCPTCGTTRAAVALLDGRILDALASNPLATAVAMVWVAGGALATVWAVLRLRAPRGFGPRLATVAMIATAAVIANWVYMIIRS